MAKSVSVADGESETIRSGRAVTLTVPALVAMSTGKAAWVVVDGASATVLSSPLPQAASAVAQTTTASDARMRRVTAVRSSCCRVGWIVSTGAAVDELPFLRERV